jgi:hypothetical protein
MSIKPTLPKTGKIEEKLISAPPNVVQIYFKTIPKPRSRRTEGTFVFLETTSKRYEKTMSELSNIRTAAVSRCIVIRLKPILQGPN